MTYNIHTFIYIHTFIHTYIHTYIHDIHTYMYMVTRMHECMDLARLSHALTYVIPTLVQAKESEQFQYFAIK